MSQAYDPQQMGRILRLAMEEILGREGLRSVLQAARLPAAEEAKAVEAIMPEPPASGGEDVGVRELPSLNAAQTLDALEQVYGAQAGRGLAQRIGRACLPYGVREYGEALGITSTSFRLLPFPTKLNTFAAALAKLFKSTTGDEPRFEERDGKLLWHMEHCPFCGERRAESPICLLPVGLAEESLYWLSGGKMFIAEEVACIARGDRACILQVDETPLS